MRVRDDSEGGTEGEWEECAGRDGEVDAGRGLVSVGFWRGRVWGVQAPFGVFDDAVGLEIGDIEGGDCGHHGLQLELWGVEGCGEDSAGQRNWSDCGALHVEDLKLSMLICVGWWISDSPAG